eukprot:1913776-Alexandrium_andersonii.AAC.1
MDFEARAHFWTGTKEVNRLFSSGLSEFELACWAFATATAAPVARARASGHCWRPRALGSAAGACGPRRAREQKGPICLPQSAHLR